MHEPFCHGKVLSDWDFWKVTVETYRAEQMKKDQAYTLLYTLKNYNMNLQTTLLYKITIRLYNTTRNDTPRSKGVMTTPGPI